VNDLARRDGLDIAVDLKGYTQNSRSGLFAGRLAPIQIAYLGYPGTMGACFIDYIVADRTVIPAAQRRHYTEHVLRLPHSYQANDDQRVIAADPQSRAHWNLPQDSFVFACFNNSYKISPAAFDIWMRLLSKTPGGVLWLLRSNPWAQANLRKEAAIRGVDPARLIFAENRPVAEHLARQRHADLFLDTFAYNAHTTGSDALWAGLPIVTLPGQSFAARVGASLLHAIGLPELIAESPEHYEQLALALASDPARLAAIRAKLAANRATAPLFDTERFTRGLEAAYDAAYERHLEGLGPGDIDVADPSV
jgi:predicted O-linked N-acetylglucosamine transferase (SPINDLY family)